ncbi:MAG: DNA-3-methyladenine glycosylase [Megasphaera sp.]|jgi:DNA-3-methyladenine glycosylase|nr:DNA-3-methyladenine glycosylase [Megasphaera sp.]MCH4187490.1 DNA-3-methyladenine glycosylase [Megasphaera sp.]MCH4217786.1 DNA-3-methyladenine glycosylase [Megasphaera sp.]
MIYTKWPTAAYSASAQDIAPCLLGQYLVHQTERAVYAGRIVETEAYGGTYNGKADDGSHAFHGLTKRTAPMFHQGGIVYVYLIYGMYHCVNIVTGPEGAGQAVLIRAIEPVEGIEAMLENRHMMQMKPKVTNGPGKLCQAMNITLAQNQLDLTGQEMFVARAVEKQPVSIICTPRIHIDYAVNGKSFPWRFYIQHNPYVSKA